MEKRQRQRQREREREREREIHNGKTERRNEIGEMR
jgi:hypothetical protein